MTRISASGSTLGFSNLLGRPSQNVDIAVDDDSNSYVTMDGDMVPAVAKLGGDGWVVVYTELKGSGAPTSIALDGARNVYLTGYTFSPDFDDAGCLRPDASDVRRRVRRQAQSDHARLEGRLQGRGLEEPRAAGRRALPEPGGLCQLRLVLQALTALTGSSRRPYPSCPAMLDILLVAAEVNT